MGIKYSISACQKVLNVPKYLERLEKKNKYIIQHNKLITKTY